MDAEKCTNLSAATIALSLLSRASSFITFMPPPPSRLFPRHRARLRAERKQQATAFIIETAVNHCYSHPPKVSDKARR